MLVGQTDPYRSDSEPQGMSDLRLTPSVVLVCRRDTISGTVP